jgi:hypothetical protein
LVLAVSAALSMFDPFARFFAPRHLSAVGGALTKAVGRSGADLVAEVQRRGD